REGEVLEKTYRFPAFGEAINFIVSVAGVAEESRHHPDIQNSWRTVVLSLTTHDAGGLTEKDFEVAKRIDTLSP
ncbi:MAG: 4a-hydroxytetrahydrobiopterin dehydratase, partial [Candidatus Geothermarchaeales archaeon]